MRKLSEMIQEFRSHPLRYWLGWNPPCSFDLSHGSIIQRVGDSVSELAPIADIASWKSLSRRATAIRLPDQTIIVGDSSGNLRSILLRTVGDREERDEEEDV